MTGRDGAGQDGINAPVKKRRPEQNRIYGIGPVKSKTKILEKMFERREGDHHWSFWERNGKFFGAPDRTSRGLPAQLMGKALQPLSPPRSFSSSPLQARSERLFFSRVFDSRNRIFYVATKNTRWGFDWRHIWCKRTVSALVVALGTASMHNDPNPAPTIDRKHNYPSVIPPLGFIMNRSNMLASLFPPITRQDCAHDVNIPTTFFLRIAGDNDQFCPFPYIVQWEYG